MPSSLASTSAGRCRTARAAHPAVLASLLTSSPCSYPSLQIRGYRFGRLSSYFIHYISPDVYTRGKSPGYNKYCQNLYRSCDPHALAKHVANDVKRVVNNVVNNYLYLDPGASQHASRSRNTSSPPRRTPDNPEGIRPGQNIEDVERAPWEHFLFGDKKGYSEQKQRASSEPIKSSAQQENDADYVIDPISNRKMPRKQFEGSCHLSDQDVKVTAKRFEPYKPQFEAFWAPETEESRVHGNMLGSRGKEIQWNRLGNKADAPDELEWLDKSSPLPASNQGQTSDKRSKVTTTGSLASSQELGGPKTFHYREPDRKHHEKLQTKPPDAAELEAYRKPFFSNEPDGTYAIHQGRPGYPVDELAKYRDPFFCYEPDDRHAASNSQPQPGEPELSRYEAVRSHEPNGKHDAETATASMQEAKKATSYEAPHDTETETKAMSNGYQEEDIQMESKRTLSREYDSVGFPQTATETDVEPGMSPGESNGSGRRVSNIETQKTATHNLSSSHYEQVDELMAQIAAASSTVTDAQPSTEHGNMPTTQLTLTGNYVQDFPEDFSKSWTQEITTGCPLEEDNVISGEPLQPALDRLTTGTYTPTHQAAKANPNNIGTNNPTIYKVLAYDPTTQSIHIAEATSSVPTEDRHTTPLTPAEVLPGISHPAKFLPHFARLQAEGFEIVSGSGDVLIFRKVRESTVAASAEEAGTNEGGRLSAINPIDMTGEPRADDLSVKALRFSSPTGFVNYCDLPLPGESRLRSEAEQDGAGERRGGGEALRNSSESGAYKHGEEMGGNQSSRKKSGLPRKLALGTASLAGAAYSIGVVTEYFRNGGVDGRGPKRF
ncbi:hypothetical protein VTJ83DRAFT_4602 [Remersonia thermophila]|uniref:Uncharacterized protein n=1 Tax=Remersonia thermophila TaxID=72144 RepID=A0ABR4DAD0_9PEZI